MILFCSSTCPLTITLTNGPRFFQLSYALFEQMDKASAANDVGKESIYLTRLPLKTVLDALKQKRKNW
jgi:hypothetical protein